MKTERFSFCYAGVYLQTIVILLNGIYGEKLFANDCPWLGNRSSNLSFDMQKPAEICNSLMRFLEKNPDRENVCSEGEEIKTRCTMKLQYESTTLFIFQRSHFEGRNYAVVCKIKKKTGKTEISCKRKESTEISMEERCQKKTTPAADKCIRCTEGQSQLCPITTTSPTSTTVSTLEGRNQGPSTATLTGGVVGGVLGGIVITVIVVVIWWICRRKRSLLRNRKEKTGSRGMTRTASNPAAHTAVPDVIKVSTAQTVEGTSTNEYSVIVDRSYRQARQTRLSDSRPSPSSPTSAMEPAAPGDYIDIKDIDLDRPAAYSLAKDFPTSVPPSQSKQGLEATNTGEIKDTYNRLGTHSAAKSNKPCNYNRLDYTESNDKNSPCDTHPSADHIVLEDDKNAYNKLGAKTDLPNSNIGQYDRIGGTGVHTRQSVKQDVNTSDYFVLEKAERPLANDIYNQLGVNPDDARENLKGTYNRLGDTEVQDERIGQTQISSKYFVLEKAESPQTSDTYNRLRVNPDDAKENLKDTYNNLGDAEVQDERSGQTEHSSEYFVLEKADD